jgi:glycosyltransferase involved in cell wall biosynthesis
MTLQISVVVPSHNRRATLEMVLAGLAAQTLPKAQFEVVVVLDGCRDDSPHLLSEWAASGRLPNLRWLEQPQSGQAAARNNGAAAAAAPVLLFIDDDVVPEPELLERHLAYYTGDEAIAVLGDCLIVRERAESLYHLGVWAWWEDMYQQRSKPGRQPGYRDFCAGNVSLRRETFLAAGGFDTAFRGYGGEDYELGYRLIQAGVRLIADRRLRARHYHRTIIAGVLRATRQEAHGEVLLGRKHPELRAGLRLHQQPPGSYGLMKRLALSYPALGDQAIKLLRVAQDMLERLNMRRRWLFCFDLLRGYAYWRGARDEFGSAAALDAYCRETIAAPTITIELEPDGRLPATLPQLYVDGPSRIILAHQGEYLGTIAIPGFIEAPVREYLHEQIVYQLGPTLWARLAAQGCLPMHLTWLTYPDPANV